MAWKSKEQRNEYERRVREENREQIREYQRQYREKNRERLRVKRAAHYQANKTHDNERSKLYRRQWRDDNKEREQTKAREYSRANRPKINALRKVSRSKRPPEWLQPERIAYMKDYAKKNESVLKRKRQELYSANRDVLLPLMRERGLAKWLKRAGWSKEELERQVALGCRICGDKKPLGIGGLVFDHDHDSGEVRGLLCARCNKFLDWAIDYYEEIGCYHRCSLVAAA